MSQDMFIKLTGIDGESKDSAHTNEIDVLNWSWRIAQESTMHTGSGGGTGKAQVDDLEFEHYVDRATPNLFKYCVTGKHIPAAKRTVRSGGGTGKAQVDDLEFEHYVDRATPNLFKYCVTGKHIPEAKLTVRKAGGNPLEYLKITLTDVVVTLVSPSGSSSDEV